MFNQKLQAVSKYFHKTLLTKYGEISLTPLLRSLSIKPSILHIKPDVFHKRCAHRTPSHLHYIGQYPLVYRTVGQEFEKAVANYSSRESIVSCHEGVRHTFSSLYDEVDRVAAAFLKLGLKHGDNVGIWGPNNMHWYLSLLGAARVGLVSVGINPAFQAPEVEYCLKKAHCKVIIAPHQYKTQNYYEILKSICPELPHCEPGKIKSDNLPHLKTVIIDTDTHLKGALTFDDILNLGSSTAKEIPKIQHSIVPDDPCNIQFTSGTTGHPKAAVLSHYNFVNNGIHLGQRNEIPGERICVQVPLFHAYGVVITIMAGMVHGATLVLPSPGFSPEHSLRAIVDEKCTIIHGTPTMYVDLIKKQRELNLPLKTCKLAITGGAPCSPQLFRDIKDVLGLEQVRTVFGLTETTAVVFQSLPGDTEEQILNTVGHIQDHIEAKVIDAEGKTVPFGVPGELCVRGYVTMLGYYGDEEKTKETMGPDKWLRTGDQFILQEDGYGRIVGRLKEMIIRGGENIFPKEVEDFLNTHPKIIETHVIGVPDERLGEELCAFVRLQDGVKEISREDIKQYCKGKLAHFKVPRYVISVHDFPKTTSGKIQKFKLKEIFDNEHKHTQS